MEGWVAQENILYDSNYIFPNTNADSYQHVRLLQISKSCNKRQTFNGINLDEWVAPIPGRPCLTGFYPLATSPKESIRKRWRIQLDNVPSSLVWFQQCWRFFHYKCQWRFQSFQAQQSYLANGFWPWRVSHWGEPPSLLCGVWSSKLPLVVWDLVGNGVLHGHEQVVSTKPLMTVF